MNNMIFVLASFTQNDLIHAMAAAMGHAFIDHLCVSFLIISTVFGANITQCLDMAKLVIHLNNKLSAWQRIHFKIETNGHNVNMMPKKIAPNS